MRYHLSYIIYSEDKCMLITDKLGVPGDHALLSPGVVGPLEVRLLVPKGARRDYVALIGHPHSLQGGTMNNKVVTTLARVFHDLGVASIRCNFRGVGQSFGVYDAGVGESEDLLVLARACLEANPETKLLFAGFSFGSYVAYRAAAACEHALLITVAPSVHHYDYSAYTPEPTPWIVVQGDEDELIPLPLILDFVKRTSPPKPFLCFANTTHFFHGKLVELKSRLTDAICAEVPDLCP